MDEVLRRVAREAKGFMPDEEGFALHRAGLIAADRGPLLEVGSYCGKSAVYLGAAARVKGVRLYSVDHHRGSEEHQPGEAFHDPDLMDPISGAFDSLPEFRRTIAAAGLEDVVVAIVGRSGAIARDWTTPLGMVFIDGGHSMEAAIADLEGWARLVADGGTLAIHDVFPDPADGGRPPYEIYRMALDSEEFEEVKAVASLRVLRRRAREFS